MAALRFQAPSEAPRHVRVGLMCAPRVRGVDEVRGDNGSRFHPRPAGCRLKPFSGYDGFQEQRIVMGGGPKRASCAGALALESVFGEGRLVIEDTRRVEGRANHTERVEHQTPRRGVKWFARQSFDRALQEDKS